MPFNLWMKMDVKMMMMIRIFASHPKIVGYSNN